MQLTGKLEQLLPIVTGQGKNGEWRKQEFVITTEGDYSKKVVMSLWGDKTELLNSAMIGKQYTISFDIESREYNSRWYTECKAWKVEGAQQQAAQQQTAFKQPEAFTTAPVEDDLPF